MGKCDFSYTCFSSANAGTPHVANMVVTNGLLSLIIQFLDSTFDLKQDVSCIDIN